jgi:taurine dioxygenase
MNHISQPYEHILVAQFAAALGPEVNGVDLYKLLANKILAPVKQAYVENLVIFFRYQDIIPDQQKTFAQHFRKLSINDLISKLDGHAEIQITSKEPHQRMQCRTHMAKRCHL